MQKLGKKFKLIYLAFEALLVEHRTVNTDCAGSNPAESVRKLLFETCRPQSFQPFGAHIALQKILKRNTCSALRF